MSSKRKTIAADPWKKHVGANNQPATTPKKVNKPRKKAAPRPKPVKAAAPKAEPKTAPVAPAKPAPTAAAPVRQAAAAPAPAPVSAAKVQLSLRFDPTLLERVRNACHAQSISFQSVIDQALTGQLEQMEADNGGPFAPRPGTLKTGPRPS